MKFGQPQAKNQETGLIIKGLKLAKNQQSRIAFCATKNNQFQQAQKQNFATMKKPTIPGSETSEATGQVSKHTKADQTKSPKSPIFPTKEKKSRQNIAGDI